ncbi:MAG: LiaF domain-containing protein [Candidatus Zixiibacteriota bacterium]
MSGVSGSGSRVVFGLTVVGLGVLFLVSTWTGRSVGATFALFWPALIIIVGVWQWAGMRFRLALWPLLLIGLGAALLAFRLELLSLRTLVALLGALLIVSGLWLVLRRAQPAARATSEADAIDQWVVFGGVDEAITSRQFSGGNVTVVFGGAEVDLRQAALASGDVNLDLLAIFGGIEVQVPEDWQVVVDGSAILGGIEDTVGRADSQAITGQPRLLIDATAIFGGIEVKR